MLMTGKIHSFCDHRKVAIIIVKYYTTISFHFKKDVIILGYSFAVHSEKNVRPAALLKLRRSLPRVREGEEVLARWSDEGWYYSGMYCILSVM